MSDPHDEALASRLGMWVFIGTELMFFGGLLFAYMMARLAHAPGFAQASRHTDIVIGTANTVILLCSSAAVALAAEVAQRGAHHLARLALWLTLLLGASFMALKGLEYAHDWQQGLFPGVGVQLGQLGQSGIQHEQPLEGAQLFFMLYYVITALHAVHLLIGMGAILWLLAHESSHSIDTHVRRTEITALYWHFVDVVWILLYPLLYLIDRSTP
ncbi:MAG: cytochrome c oxidase subunit 3 [Aquabacterium sp.]